MRRRPIADQKLLQKVGGGGQKHGMQSGSGPSLEVVRTGQTDGRSDCGIF